MHCATADELAEAARRHGIDCHAELDRDAWHIAGARVEFCWQPLVIYNIVTNSISRSRRMNWQDSMDWAESYHLWMSPRAYNSFLTTKVALKAKRAHDWRGLREIISKVMHNQPSFLDILFLGGMVLLPGFMLHLAWKRSLASGEVRPRVERLPRIGMLCDEPLRFFVWRHAVRLSSCK